MTVLEPCAWTYEPDWIDCGKAVRVTRLPPPLTLLQQARRRGDVSSARTREQVHLELDERMDGRPPTTPSLEIWEFDLLFYLDKTYGRSSAPRAPWPASTNP